MKRAMLAAGAAAILGLAAPSAQARVFAFTGTIVNWSAPSAGLYEITAWGAQGGAGPSGAAGGLGAEVGGQVTLTLGETLSILVGGAGDAGVGDGVFDPGGGGGGSYVVSGAAALVVAGGGGGGTFSGAGAAGVAGAPYGSGGGGSGGTAGGGGGFSGDGGGSRGATGGKAFLNGGDGGPGFFWEGNLGGDGGFGGGGGGDGFYGSGGSGGGYTGGDGPPAPLDVGFGGGSYFVGAPAVQLDGVNPGDGMVEIRSIGVPEPATWAMMLLGFGGLGALARRGRAPGQA